MSLRQSTLGFIGLGRMGQHMAANLFAARPNDAYVVCDASPDAAAAFARRFSAEHPAASIHVAQSPAELAARSSTIISMLPSTPHVEQVYLSPGGIHDLLATLSAADAQRTLIIDSTTLDVQASRRVSQRIQTTGALFVDAPVSGGVTGAKAGTLSFLVGGSSAAFTASSPVLEAMGRRIIHCGEAGAGLAAKICNNLVLGVQQVVVAEAMLLGQRVGLDPRVLASVINSSTGACWASSENNPVKGALLNKTTPADRDYEGGFATALMSKDMGLAQRLAEETQTPIPLGEAAQSVYKEMAESDAESSRLDFSVVYKYLAR